jgi:RNA polymerase sigma-70 factor (ECF subfamily)
MREAPTDPAEAEPMQALVGRFELPLLQFATRILGDRDRARDVVQETFVSYQRDSVSHSLNGKPATWLFTVCRNRALNVCRKEKRMTYLDQEILETSAAHDPLPAEQLEQKEARGFLLRIVESLPARQQEIIQLKFQNDLSYQQISEVTQLSVSNVGVILHNALKTLRERYAETAKEFIQFNPRTT